MDSWRDFAQKMEAIRTLLGVWSRSELAEAILHHPQCSNVSNRDLLDLTEILRDEPRCGLSIPSSHELTAGLIARLKEIGCNDKGLEAILVNGTYAEFFELIPMTRRQGLQLPHSHDSMNEYGQYEQLPSGITEAESAPEGLKRGRIDQKLYYLNPDSVEVWRNVVDAGQYRQYDECKHALVGLTHTDLWSSFFSQGKGHGAVVLGGGSPPKDLIVIRSMLTNLNRQEPIRYALVDYSPHMLESTYNFLERTLLNDGSHDRVNLIPIKADILNLTGISGKVRTANQNLVWLIPGGTIGNLDEGCFFASVAREARMGDLLVVGAETLSGDRVDALEARLSAKYAIPEVRRFVETPVRSMLNDKGFQGSVQDALDRIEVRVVRGEANIHSAVDNAATVEISLSFDDNTNVVLLTSTRYDESELIRLAAAWGFNHKLSVPSPINVWYKQVVFEFGNNGDLRSSW